MMVFDIENILKTWYFIVNHPRRVKISPRKIDLNTPDSSSIYFFIRHHFVLVIFIQFLPTREFTKNAI